MHHSISCESEKMKGIASEDEDIKELHTKLANDSKSFKEIDEKPFADTPLHEAVATGHTHLSMELTTIKPSFARKLNPEGFSPMHLALRHRHIQTVRALMTVDTKLIRVKGRYRVTPLHYAVEIGEEEILAEFLCACPESIEDLTSRCKTAVHIAVKNKNLRAFKVLFGWLKRVSLEEILNWKDEDGNTVFHIATSTEQPEVIKMLIKEVNVNARNFYQKTALDLFEMQPHKNEEVRKILNGARVKNASRLSKPITLADYLIRNLTFIEGREKVLGMSNPISREKSNTDIRNIILVIAVLIAMATYQAVLSPPGGFWQEDYSVPHFSPTSNMTETVNESPHRAEEMVMEGMRLICFFMANTLAFLTSVTTILTMITGLVYTQMLSLSVGFLLINYSVSMSYNFHSEYRSWAAIFAGLVLYLCVVLVFGTPLLSLEANKLKGRIDTPKRRVGDFLNSICGTKFL